MTAVPDDDEVAPHPPPFRLRQRLWLGAGALVFAAIVTVGWLWAAGDLTPRPVESAHAGADVCQLQVMVNFVDDHDLEAHQGQLRATRDVLAVAVQTQRQMLDWYREQFTRSGHPELADLLRVDGMPARAWLAAASDDLGRVRADVQAHIASAPADVGVANPCRTNTPSSATALSPEPTSR